MRRQLSINSKVTRSGHDAAAEVVSPDPVHPYPCGQWVFWTGHPLCKRGTPSRGLRRCRRIRDIHIPRQTLQKARLDGISREVGIPAAVDAIFPKRRAGVCKRHRHRDLLAADLNHVDILADIPVALHFRAKPRFDFGLCRLERAHFSRRCLTLRSKGTVLIAQRF